MDLEQHKRNANEGEDYYTSNEMPDRVHIFYFIKYRPCEDPKIMRKVAHAKFEIQRKKEEIDCLKEALKAIEVKHKSIRNILHINSYWENHYWRIADWKSEELARIQDFLKKDSKSKGTRLRLPEEEELVNLIKALNHRVKNKILSANEEKRLMKQMKEIEATREKIMANASLEAKQNQEEKEKENELLFSRIVDAPIKEWIKSQVKFIERTKEMHLQQIERVKHLSKNLKALDTEIRLVNERITTASSKIEKVREVLIKSEKFHLEAFATLNDANALAKEEDTAALEELSKNQMEKFFSQWSNNKIFKDEYERRVLQSIESRGLSRDGRIRNSDETDPTS